LEEKKKTHDRRDGAKRAGHDQTLVVTLDTFQHVHGDGEDNPRAR
jgi:hypothetical protein